MIRRRSLLFAGASFALAGPAWAASSRELKVYKTADCTCCEGWVSAMAGAGFSATVVPSTNIVSVWRTHRVPDALSSCHLGLVQGYVFVGHVPPSDVTRLLQEKPKAIGLSVPGMPWGSPGMEGPDGRKEAYETLLILEDGKTRVFARHA
jgi:hypothetical protein